MFRHPCPFLQVLKCGIVWCVFPIPPREASPDEFAIEASAIRQDHISHGAPIPVGVLDMDGDSFSEGQRGRELLGLGTERLALLRAVYPVQSDLLSLAVVHDFDRVAVRNADYAAREVGEGRRTKSREKEQDKKNSLFHTGL